MTSWFWIYREIERWHATLKIRNHSEGQTSVYLRSKNCNSGSLASARNPNSASCGGWKQGDFYEKEEEGQSYDFHKREKLLSVDTNMLGHFQLHIDQQFYWCQQRTPFRIGIYYLSCLWKIHSQQSYDRLECPLPCPLQQLCKAEAVWCSPKVFTKFKPRQVRHFLYSACSGSILK